MSKKGASKRAAERAKQKAEAVAKAKSMAPEPKTQAEPEPQKQATPKEPASPEPATPEPQQKTWKTSLDAWWTRLAPAAALIVAFIGIIYTHYQASVSTESLDEMRQQNYLTQYAQMRASGGITAEIEFASIIPAGFKELGQDEKVLAEAPKMDFKDIDALLRFRPTLVLNNVGEEPIEAIRVVTNLFRAFVPEKGIFRPMLREQEKDDILLPEQWLPGKSVQISLVKGMLGQMVQIQSIRERQDAKHLAYMQVRVSGKITGSTVFGRGGEDRIILCLVQWMPNGFPEDKAREVLGGYQSMVKFGPKAPVLIPRKSDDKPGKK